VEQIVDMIDAPAPRPSPRRQHPGRRHRRTAASAFVAAAAALGALPVAAQSLGVRVEAGYTYDDNVTRGRKGTDNVLSDQSLGLNVAKTFVMPVSTHTRLMLTLQGGGEKFVDFEGLDRASLGGNLGFQYRPSGDFLAPTFTVFGRWFADRFDSDLRDGQRSAVGVTIRQPVTDRIELSATGQYNRRDGRSAVFDGSDWSGRLNVDYMLPTRHTLYVGAEIRRGDAVSVGRSSPALSGIARAWVLDDVFTDAARYAYRIRSNTTIATIGYNLPFANRHSLDLSWRHIRSEPTEQSGAYGGDIRYIVNQVSVAYLVRF
jgi:hypothetical protein